MDSLTVYEGVIHGGEHDKKRTLVAAGSVEEAIKLLEKVDMIETPDRFSVFWTKSRLPLDSQIATEKGIWVCTKLFSEQASDYSRLV